jgi:very-short-patch-repair endonuclease
LNNRAAEMRRSPTEPEKRLWRALSNGQLEGHKFRRQAVIGPYIADFLCPQRGLVVEVDGDTHDAESDQKRDHALAGYGLRVFRVTNLDVMRNLDGVLRFILGALQSVSERGDGPHPNPSPEGEGLLSSDNRI